MIEIVRMFIIVKSNPGSHRQSVPEGNIALVSMSPKFIPEDFPDWLSQRVHQSSLQCYSRQEGGEGFCARLNILNLPSVALVVWIGFRNQPGVSQDEEVVAGQVIGRLPENPDGKSVLYLELRAAGTAIDPLQVVPLSRD